MRGDSGDDGVAAVRRVRAVATSLQATVDKDGKVEVVAALDPVHHARSKLVDEATLKYAHQLLRLLAKMKPVAFVEQGVDLFKLSTALAPLEGAVFLGEVARIVHVLAERLGVPLRYPLTPAGPRSSVSCVSRSGVVEWLPLQPNLTGLFQRALSMLVFDLDMVCVALYDGNPPPDLHTLTPLRRLWGVVQPKALHQEPDPLEGGWSMM